MAGKTFLRYNKSKTVLGTFWLPLQFWTNLLQNLMQQSPILIQDLIEIGLLTLGINMFESVDGGRRTMAIL